MDPVDSSDSAAAGWTNIESSALEPHVEFGFGLHQIKSIDMSGSAYPKVSPRQNSNRGGFFGDIVGTFRWFHGEAPGIKKMAETALTDCIVKLTRDP